MTNPFQRRATEYVRDDEAFLSLVSPEPVKYFLAEEGSSGRLFDRLVVIRGTPGSGKTTLGRLFETTSLITLLRNSTLDTYRPLVTALTEVGAIRDSAPVVAGCRLPLETDFRDFWEFPYPAELRSSLMHALIQARAVLAWMRNFLSAGYSLEGIQIVPRPDAYAATDAIGGHAAKGIIERARAVEAALYGVISSLVAPPIEQLSSDATGSYRPFDVIDRFRVEGGPLASGSVDLIPIVILDDAHTLHPDQFTSLQRWLVRRELRLSRWILTRLDILQPSEALASLGAEPAPENELPGIGLRRDVNEILLQSRPRERRSTRMTFRRMARDMAERYLQQMPQFTAKHLTDLAALLPSDIPILPPSKVQELEAAVTATARRLSLSDARLGAIRDKVAQYERGAKALSDDVRAAIVVIMLHRFAKRAEGHRALFETADDTPQIKPLDVNGGVADGAELHLLHQHDRPFFVGFDVLCDAASENAEQFLRLAAVLVDASAAQLTRGKPGPLAAKAQHTLLRDTAGRLIDEWNFPHAPDVRSLVDIIAEKCLEVSLQPNAPLAAGANAMGIPQHDFEQIPDKHPPFARCLQFAIAYNAITLVPRYECKKKTWCLLELGGIPLLHHGLTLKRGGFIESTAAALAALLKEPQ
jgi:hypothetical protein